MGVKVTGQFEPAGDFSIVDGKDVSGHLTGSNISASGTVYATQFSGDGSTLTGVVSGAEISGSWQGHLSSSKVTFGGDIRVAGEVVAERYVVSSSVTHLTQSFSSGSTIFGDTSDDTHVFVGNTISGSSTSTGSFGAVAIGGTLQPGLGFQSYKQALIKNGLAIGANATWNGLSSGILDVWTDVNIRNTSGTDKFKFDVSEGDFILYGANAKISGSASSTGSFGAVAIGKGTADNDRALTVVGNAQFDNNAQIY